MATYEPEHVRTMQARVQPTSDAALVEYLLSTEQPEMEFETARCRPLLTQEFMAFLKQEVGAFLFSSKELRLSARLFLHQHSLWEWASGIVLADFQHLLFPRRLPVSHSPQSSCI